MKLLFVFSALIFSINSFAAKDCDLWVSGLGYNDVYLSYVKDEGKEVVGIDSKSPYKNCFTKETSGNDYVFTRSNNKSPECVKNANGWPRINQVRVNRNNSGQIESIIRINMSDDNKNKYASTFYAQRSGEKCTISNEVVATVPKGLNFMLCDELAQIGTSDLIAQCADINDLTSICKEKISGAKEVLKSFNKATSKPISMLNTEYDKCMKKGAFNSKTRAEAGAKSKPGRVPSKSSHSGRGRRAPKQKRPAGMGGR